MSIQASWFCYCDDCDEKIDSDDYSHNSATEARRSAQGLGAVLRKMRDGKMYDFCKDCIEDHAHREDDSVPTKSVRR